MTDKKYSGLDSRIVLGTLRLASNSDEEDIFLSDSIADRPELRVQLRCFTVELKPTRYSKNDCRNLYTNRKSRNSVNGQKKVELGKSVSPIETTSCDSFYSCRSTTSIQELACKDNDIETSSRAQSHKIVGGSNKTIIRDDDILNHLTMVNAIFLSQSASNSIQHNIKHNEKHQENAKRWCKTDKDSSSRRPIPSNQVCSETVMCQINHNPKVEYKRKIHGNNIITKPVENSVDTHYEKISGDKLSYAKTFSESFEPVLNSKHSDFEVVKQFNSYNINYSPSTLNEHSPSNCDVKNNQFYNSYFLTSKLLEIKFPEKKFAEIIPICNESCLPQIVVQNFTNKVSHIDNKIRRTIPGCEESSKFSTPNNSLTLISIDSKGSFSDSTDTLHGDGDYSGYSYTENNVRSLNKLELKSVDDIYLRVLITKSLNNIKSESNLRNPEFEEPNIFESDKEYDDWNEYNEDVLKQNSYYSTQPFLRCKKRKLESCFQENERDRYSTDGNVNIEDDYCLPLGDERVSDNNLSELGSELVTQLSYELVNKKSDNRTCKQEIHELTRTLPVIQEESSEENDDFREDDLADDYCLIDSNGRPIHLFDNHGLPLTDNSGRPLRSAQGKLLMNCDKHGIPMVDHGCSIFDMLGRQPHEENFDPSMAAKKTVCSKLSAGDGRPLLLYDAQGRPLTSISGTMLVDSSGRGLVQLCSTEENETSP